jgi:hypothetical protein
MEGLGTRKGADGNDIVTHEALGILTWDPAQKKALMRAYRTGGQFVDADVTLEPNKLTWEVQHPGLGRYALHDRPRRQGTVVRDRRDVEGRLRMAQIFRDNARASAAMKFLKMSDLDLAGKRVFIRADLNVPQDEAGNITDDTRIRASVPGIRIARDAGAAVMVTSHLGRPTEGELKPEDSLAPIAKRLSDQLGSPVRPGAELGRRRLRRQGPAKSCCSRIAAATGARRRTTRHSRKKMAGAVRRLRQRRVRHRPSRRKRRPKASRMR